MNPESKLYFQASKNARIIRSLCDLYGVSLQKATDIYYSSDYSELIEEGIGDLNCRSDKYLASLIWDEIHDADESEES